MVIAVSSEVFDLFVVCASIIISMYTILLSRVRNGRTAFRFGLTYILGNNNIIAFVCCHREMTGVDTYSL